MEDGEEEGIIRAKIVVLRAHDFCPRCTERIFNLIKEAFKDGFPDLEGRVTMEVVEMVAAPVPRDPAEVGH